MVSLVSHSALAFLLSPLFYSSFFDTNHILPYIFLHLSLLLATNSFLLLILLSSISSYVLLPVHHDVTRLSQPSTLYLSVHILFLPLAPSFPLSATYFPQFLYFHLLYLLYYSNYIFVFTPNFFYFFYYFYFWSFYYYFLYTTNPIVLDKYLIFIIFIYSYFSVQSPTKSVCLSHLCS